MRKYGWVINKALHCHGSAFYMPMPHTWSETEHPNVSKVPAEIEIMNKGNLLKEYETLSHDYQSYNWIKSAFGKVRQVKRRKKEPKV